MNKINTNKIFHTYLFLLIINYTIEGFLKLFPVLVGEISILWLISVMLQWTCFLLLVCHSIKYASKQKIVVIFSLFIMFLYTYIFHRQNFQICPSLIPDILQGGCILYAVSDRDNMNYLENAISKASYVTFIVLCLYPILNTREIFSTTNYMVFSNGMIVPVIFFAYRFFKGHFIYFIPMLIGLMEILFCGSRSPLLSLIVFTMIYYGIFDKTISKKRVLLGFLILFSIIILSLIVTDKALLINIYQWVLNTTGKYSRTLYELIYGKSVLDLHGREDIYFLFLKNIPDILLSGHGLAGDRLFLANTAHLYSHNLLIEIWIEFGAVTGTCLIFLLSFYLLHPFKKKVLCKNSVFYIMLFSIVIGKLLLSSSWIQEPLFYLLLGTALSIKHNRIKQ